MLSKFKKNFNPLYNLFLFIYLIFGFYFSVKTGITADEFIDQHNWNLSFEVIKNFLFNSNDSSLDILEYEWKFHGVGFHYISQIYLFIASKFVNFASIDSDSSKVLLNHSFIFFIFFISGIISRKIINMLIKDNYVSKIFLIFYLLYPYLLGHGFFNPKDIPFLFAWILSTFLSIKIFIKILNKEKITFFDVFVVSFSSAFLLSIRISGILIFLQYLISFFISSSILKVSVLKLVRDYFVKIFQFIFITSLLVFLFYPIFWINPLSIVDSINQFKNIPYGVCTLTWGACMDALNLPSSYILIWLLFKIPLLCFLGLLLFPLVERKIFLDKERQLIFGSLALSILAILFLLIFLGVNLYDELRHILFVLPIIIILTFTSLYFFSKKITIIFSTFSIFIFLIQNINMFPYQYTWFNSLSSLIEVEKKFELDYWGVSGRNIATKINKNQVLLSQKNNCIYVSPIHIVKPFISSEYSCIKPFFSIFPSSSEKYILIKYTRNIRRENPSNCDIVFEESYNLNLFEKKMVMGEVYICN